MFGMSAAEMLVVAIIALVILGPEKLPEMARMAGKTLRELRKASNQFRDILYLEEAQQEAKARAQKRAAALPAPATQEDKKEQKEPESGTISTKKEEKHIKEATGPTESTQSDQNTEPVENTENSQETDSKNTSNGPYEPSSAFLNAIAASMPLEEDDDWQYMGPLDGIDDDDSAPLYSEYNIPTRQKITLLAPKDMQTGQTTRKIALSSPKLTQDLLQVALSSAPKGP